MEEGAVADGAHGGLGQAGQPHAVQYAHARAHGPHGVLGIEGRQGAEVVAADVARHRHLHLGKVVERGAVRAAGAQQRAAAGEAFGRVAERGGRIFKDARLAAAFGDVLRQQFAADGENVLAARGDAHSPDLLLDEGVKLLDHDDVAHAVRELPDQLLRQGVAHAELEDGGFGEDLLHVFVDDAPGDEAVFAVAPFDAVAGPRVAPFLDVQQALFKDVVPLACPRAHGVVLLDVAGEGADLAPVGAGGAELHHGLGMRGAHGRADDHGRVEAFAHVHGFDHEILTFLAVTGLQHGEFAELGIVAVVLLVLGAEQARIVGGDDHERGFRAGVGGIEQRIGHDVHAHLLGGHERAAPGIGRARSGVHRHLLVYRPF